MTLKTSKGTFRMRLPPARSYQAGAFVMFAAEEKTCPELVPWNG